MPRLNSIEANGGNLSIMPSLTIPPEAQISRVLTPETTDTVAIVEEKYNFRDKGRLRIGTPVNVTRINADFVVTEHKTLKQEQKGNICPHCGPVGADQTSRYCQKGLDDLMTRWKPLGTQYSFGR